MSQTYQRKPSQLVRLKQRLSREDVFDPDWLCFCFDRAVRTWGIHVQNQLDKAKSSREAQFILEGLLMPSEERAEHQLAPVMAQMGASPDTPIPDLVRLLMDEDG